MAGLYSDEDFSYPVVEELRRLGHDVLTVRRRGRRISGSRIPQSSPSRSPELGPC
ncbi:MAG: DUF5615 family PIN-like protein [Isosphaeraceae bacterium]